MIIEHGCPGWNAAYHRLRPDDKHLLTEDYALYAVAFINHPAGQPPRRIAPNAVIHAPQGAWKVCEDGR